LLQETRRKQEEQDRHQRKRRRTTSDGNVFKMGHGGTLDPMATGVLIVGIGRGTKSLGDFLDCTKTYETVVIFGKSTDTYDVAGKIVSDAPFDHVTRELVEKKLDAFRGKIKQVPPIYSALKINGMKAYEYARSGKELHRELESRNMNVTECVLLDWFEGGKHEFRWPATEASEEDKTVARKLMKVEEKSSSVPLAKPGIEEGTDPPVRDESKEGPDERTKQQERKTSLSRAELNSLTPSAKAALHTHEQSLSDIPADGPAARIRLTVSSGFYVRSFAHDLGIACGSYGTMAALSRSRQGDYTCNVPAPDSLIPSLTYEDLDQGEDVWGSKLETVLRDWAAKNSSLSQLQRVDDRDKPSDSRRSVRNQKSNGYRGGNYNRQQNNVRGEQGSRKRRNSSSPER
jgi:tRNA pseudouridine55 synthase